MVLALEEETKEVGLLAEGMSGIRQPDWKCNLLSLIEGASHCPKGTGVNS